MEEKEWLMQAEADFVKAKILFENHQYDGASFYSQQTAEKSLKALIIKKSGELWKIHDLVVLGRKAGVNEELLKKCKRISQIYAASRYGIVGNEIPYKVFNEENSKEYMEISREILEWVKKMI